VIRIRLYARFNLLLVFTAMALTVFSSVAQENLGPKVDALFAEYTGSNIPGASVAVIQDGKVRFAKAYGMAEVEAKIPCATNTNFRLASVTKQFTAMAVMLLAERNKLSLDESLLSFFPEFPACGQGITIRHLLNHTSGLVDYEDIIPQGTTIPVLDRDVLRLLLKEQKGYFSPGAKFRYSNSAYALLAQIIEARSGAPYAQFLKANIFQPLGMSNTLAYEQGISVVPNRAYGYSFDGTNFIRSDQSLTSSVLGDGGIYSSVSDLAKWDQALYTNTLASQKTLELIFSPGPATEHPNTAYGFGWYLGTYRGIKEIWHSGNTRGFSTRIARYPEKKFTVIILTNRSDAKLESLPHQIFDLCL